MKIDCHVHVTPPDIIKDYEKIGEREPYFDLLSHSPQNKFATAEDIIIQMKETGVDRSVIFGFSFQDMGLCQYVNDYVIEMSKRYPEQFIGFASIVPHHPQVEQEIIRCYEKGLRGIGELFPAGQGFEISNAKHTATMARCCIHYQMPVLVHTNEPIGHDYVGKTHTSLQEIEAFVTNHPELSIILAHWGGGIFVYELMKEVREKFKNVYYDTAAMVFLYDPIIYETARSIGLLDKIVFGSDYPLLSPSRYEKGQQAVNLTLQEQAQINGENFLRLLSKQKDLPIR